MDSMWIYVIYQTHISIVYVSDIDIFLCLEYQGFIDF